MQNAPETAQKPATSPAAEADGFPVTPSAPSSSTPPARPPPPSPSVTPSNTTSAAATSSSSTAGDLPPQVGGGVAGQHAGDHEGEHRLADAGVLTWLSEISDVEARITFLVISSWRVM